MPQAPIWPSIPTPKADLVSLNETVVALKRAVEMLTGQGSDDRRAAHVFMGHQPPTAMLEGDFWLFEGDTFSLNIWNGFRWILIIDVQPPAASRLGLDFLVDVHNRRARR